MCRRWVGAVLVFVLSVAMMGAGVQSGSGDRFNKLGHTMMCVCGCGQILLECNHVGCPDSERMIGELRDQLAGPNGAGADSLVLNWFVAKYGATVLAAPVRGGFDVVAWVVPLGLFAAAVVGTGLLVRMWARRRRPLVAGVGVAIDEDDPVRARIRRETEW